MAAAEQQQRSTAIAERIDRDVMGELAITDGGRVPAFASMKDILEFAKVMAVSGVAVRKHLRNNPGVCAAIVLQSQRWEMDPFTVGNKSYEVNDQIAYESQLITAVINTRAPIIGRLKTRFEGAGNARKCIAWATFRGESEPTEVESPPIGSIKPKNSPLWASDPDQQLAYYTKRLWARRECPEVLLGVYDADELEERGPDRARDVTPARPVRADFTKPSVIETQQEEPEPDPWEFTDHEGEIRTYSSHLDWVEAFTAYLSTPHATWAQTEGAWETNSPQIGRLRQMGAEGEKLAQEIHDTFGRAQAAEDERRAAERAKAEAKPDVPVQQQAAAGQGSLLDATDEQIAAQERLEKLLDGLAGNSRTRGEIDDYVAANAALIAMLQPAQRASFDAKVEERRAAVAQTVRRATR